MNNKKITIKTYDKYASNFFNKIAQLKNYNKTYDALIKLIKNDITLLDLACGPSNISYYIKKIKSNIKVYGVDLSKNMLKISKKLIPDGIYELKDIQEINYNNNFFDLIIFGFGLPYISLEAFDNLIKNKIKKILKKKVIYI